MRIRFSLLLLMCLCVCVSSADPPKRVLAIAGDPSHGYGAHEHFAGLKVLAESLDASSDAIDVTVVRGWPDDELLVASADSIVIYCDGGRRHVAIPQLETLRKRMNEGCGLVCLHYAVETVPGDVGDAMLDLLGGHFEINHSVNPHWVASIETLPDHPVARGVEPFATNDEWYFHLRFQDAHVTPILAAVAPPETMRRKDGPHSGNPSVRKSVAAGEVQTLAWTYDRPEGGRAFGFTGGHYHWNWGHDDVRRLVVNAIRWSAGDDIPESGSTLGNEVSVDDLLQNQDYDRPNDFSSDRIKEAFKL